MKRKLLLLLVALLPMIASAYDARIDGIYYYFSGDNATVTYWDIDNADYSGKVVIPESVAYNGKTYSVTSIGFYAFKRCSNLTSITIPNSVISIGYEAFYGCSSLTSITIPNSVTSIWDWAFSACSSLTSITIPNSVTSIGEDAFYKCTGLTSITIPNSVTSIGYAAFSYCTSLTSITIPNSVTSIGASAFYQCTGLTSITIPNSVTSIGGSAFWGCTSLTSITIPNSVTSIGRGAFSRCKGLTSIQVETGNTTYDSRDNCNAIIETATNTLIAGCKNTTIPNSVTSIGNSAFSGCSGLTSVTIPNSVTSIGNYAFSSCSGLTSITIPSSVTSIGGWAFLECTSLTSITIPNSVTSIGERAFYSCTSLTAITIGTGIKDIGSEAFASCKGLTDVYCFAENVPSTKANAFSDSSIGSATLHVPASSISSYSTTKPWSQFGKIVSSSMTYTLTYMIDGQVYKTYSLEYGAVITPEPAPTKEGYTFSGWSYIPPTMPATDVVVMGTFTKILKCATPTISYANGKLTFNCETEGAICHSTITDTDIKSYSGNEVDLTVTYYISVYATKEEYEDSEVATGTLCWIDQQPSTEGIVAEDAVTEVKALPILIQSNRATITVQGANEGTEVSVFSVNGMKQGSAIATNGLATIYTSLHPGSTAIVKIGEKAIKVMVK